MGKPKFSRKKYETPSHPWQADRIDAESKLTKKYGLKNKKEIWRGETALKKYRGQARELLAKIGSGDPQIKKESNQLLNRLTRLNILPLNSTLDDVLALENEAVLARRLQTLTYLRGLASTPKQARQLISHGHIEIEGRKITVPGYIVKKDEENEIGYVSGSPLNDSMHPARPSSDFKSDTVKKIEEEAKTRQESKPKPEIKKDKITGREKEGKPDKASKKPEGKPKPDSETIPKKEPAKESPEKKPKEEKPTEGTEKAKKSEKNEVKEKKPEPKKEPTKKEENKPPKEPVKKGKQSKKKNEDKPDDKNGGN